MDAVSGLPALMERSPVGDVIMFWRQLTASLCPIVHLSQRLLLEDAESKPQMDKRKSKGGAESGEN